jgi:uncharacterized membrane protein YkoI
MRISVLTGLLVGLVMSPHSGHAFDTGGISHSAQSPQVYYSVGDLGVVQKNGGKSLAEAIEQVRRQTDGRILGAETKGKGNREVHHVKVLTRDGKVKTVKVQGRRLN